MVQRLIELCSASPFLFWTTFISDVSIALAYFAIPMVMAVVLRHRKDDLVYPWLWTLFVAFIIACGLTHTAHAWSAIVSVEYLGLHAIVGAITAVASVGTAAAFALILPQIRLLPSPREQREKLAREVALRTRDKDRLIREINHRIGNQIQVLSSIVSIESRRAEANESLEVLNRLKSHLDLMAKEHVELSADDYLGNGSPGFGMSPVAGQEPSRESGDTTGGPSETH